MKIDVRGEGFGIGPDERGFAERAVLLGLGRFRRKVVGAVVTISDAWVDAGRTYQVCLRLEGPCGLLIVEGDDSFDVALLRALDRARRYVDRDAARRPSRHGRLALVPRLDGRSARVGFPAFDGRNGG